MSTSGDYPLVRHDSQIVIGREADHGVEANPDTVLGKIVDSGDMPDPEVDWQEERTISARERQLSGKEPGQNTYDGGSLTVLPVDETPFEFLLGEQLGDTNADQIRVASKPLPDTFTVEAAYYGHGTDDDFVRTFVGNAIDTGTIQVDSESRLSVDMDFLAQSVSPGTAPTAVADAPATGDVFMFYDNDSFFSLNGTNYARVTDFEWELSNNLDPRYYIQPNNAEDPYETHYGNAGHALTATVVPVDDSLFQEVIGRDDSGNASIAFETPGNKRLEFQFENVGTSSAPYSFPDEGSAEVTVNMTPDVGYVVFDPDTTV